MKKILLFLLSLSLLLSCFCLTAMAKEPLRAVRAVRISATEVVLEFSDALNQDGLKSPFVALRWMQMKDGSPTGLAWDGDTPLQAPSTSWRFWSEQDRSRVILAFDAFMLDSYLDDNDNGYYHKGYRPYLVIEEKDPPSGHSHDTLQGIKTDDGRELSSNLPGPGSNWDGMCLKVETDYLYGKGDIGENPDVTLPADSGADTQAPENEGGCGATLHAGTSVLLLGALALLKKRR